MVKKFPIHPANPERICWGCDKYCPSDSLACAAERTPHLAELFGEDWMEWAPGHAPASSTALDPERTPGLAVRSGQSLDAACPSIRQ